MREWFLSSELMQLDTMPSSTAGISVKAKRENWKSRKAKGGGRSLEYHLSNFEESVQHQLYCEEHGPVSTEDWKIESAILKSCAVEPEDLEAVKQAVRSGKDIDLLISHWQENGYPSETNHFPNLSSQQPNNVYNFVSQLIGYPIEKIKKLDSEGKLLEKLDGKLSDLNSNINKNEKANASHVKLDFYDIEVSAGHGALVIQENQTDCISFSRQFINDIGINTKNLFLMPVRGDSMVPTLKNQSIIMVNKVDEFSTDGIYVFRFDDRLMVKRLQFTKTGLTIVSDNLSYDPWQLSRDELTTEDFEIIGEVVWSGQRI